MEEKQTYRRISKGNQSRDASLSAQMNRDPERTTGTEHPDLRRVPEGMKNEKFAHPFLHTEDRLSREPSVSLGVLQTLFPFPLVIWADEEAPSEGTSQGERDHRRSATG